MRPNNQRGQMAIFIALFFQVLFVFFAMAINIGMVVHDKINLQNAVDLAAYYGAQRQAELLNQIAHINYQMRQNYKLLVWRFRVLGTIGLDAHPLNPRSRASLGGETDGEATIVPSICVTSIFWSEYETLDSNSSICRVANLNIPNIPSLGGGGGGVVPGFNELGNFVEVTREQFSRQCNEAGVFNWLFTARMLAHYRIDGAARKRMIFNLANNLSQPGENMQDIRGDSVKAGIDATLRNNLTESNLAGLGQIRFFNSMGQGQCSDRNFWLPEIRINPVIRYTDLNGTNISSCRGSAIPNRNGIGGRPAINGVDSLPSGLQVPELAAKYLAPNQILVDHWSGEPTDDLHSSLGFEKNPWCMTYSGCRPQPR